VREKKKAGPFGGRECGRKVIATEGCEASVGAVHKGKWGSFGKNCDHGSGPRIELAGRRGSKFPRKYQFGARKTKAGKKRR